MVTIFIHITVTLFTQFFHNSANNILNAFSLRVAAFCCVFPFSNLFIFYYLYITSPLSSSSCWSSPPSSSSSLARRLRCEPHALRLNQTLRPNAAGALYQLLCEASALSAGKYRFTDLHACCLCARQKRATVLQAEHTRWLRPERALSTVASLLKGGSN